MKLINPIHALYTALDLRP